MGGPHAASSLVMGLKESTERRAGSIKRKGAKKVSAEVNNRPSGRWIDVKKRKCRTPGYFSSS